MKEKFRSRGSTLSVTLVIIALILLVLICILLVYLIRKTNSEESSTKITTTTSTKSSSDGAASSDTATSSDTSSWKVYEDTNLGFKLTFNDLWEGYTMSEEVWDSTNYYHFMLKTSTEGFASDPDNPGYVSVFNISVHNKSEWEEMESIGGMMPEYIDENDYYVFGYTHWQECPQDLCFVITEQEIEKVIDTFTFTE